ncbi:hypothetical protein O3P69_002216 [Scylla paramamosain]|uniref:Uncharacterized protein n=1 Tax=Scylla paramamosain TaxID=85552 RepID=A0AAW0V6J9_SCYPA
MNILSVPISTLPRGPVSTPLKSPRLAVSPRRQRFLDLLEMDLGKTQGSVLGGVGSTPQEGFDNSVITVTAVRYHRELRGEAQEGPRSRGERRDHGAEGRGEVIVLRFGGRGDDASGQCKWWVSTGCLSQPPTQGSSIQLEARIAK